uniref:Uncharacterized protein n=1 Tax=Acrobeloides nanus TaxID=290746 RepID=A0A914E974_9BILA
MAPLYEPTMDSYGSYMPPKLTAYDVGEARKIYGSRIGPYESSPKNCEPCNNGRENLFDNENSNVETTPYIEPTEEISTTTKTKISILNSENGCPNYVSAVV